MPATLYSPSFQVREVRMNAKSVPVVEVKSGSEYKAIEFLPSKTYEKRQYLQLKHYLTTIQVAGKEIAIRNDLKSIDDVVRYLSEK